MSNKYGDKVNAITPPKMEKKDTTKPVEEKPTQQPEVKAVQEQTPPPRPNSNFSRTVEATRPNTDKRAGDRVTMEMTEYVLLLDKARDPSEVARAQNKFFGTIKSIVNQPDFTTFNKEWNSLLNFINNNRDKVNEITINRAIYAWNLSRKEQMIFSKLALLAVLSSDMKTRRKPHGVGGDNIIAIAEQLSKEAAYNIAAFYKFD